MQKLFLFQVCLRHPKAPDQNLEIWIESTTLTLAEREIVKQFGEWDTCHYQFIREIHLTSDPACVTIRT